MQRDTQKNLTQSLERLVDGELSQAEYAALLQSLEEQPDGWRQCALAFLEAQALGKELPTLALPDERTTKAAVVEGRQVGASSWRPEALLLAVAASFLAALSLGLVAPRFFPSLQFPQGPRQDVAAVGNSQGPARHEVLRPVGDVRLVMDDDNGVAFDAGQVPVFETQGDLAEWFASSAGGISSEVIGLLEQHGFEVQHQPQYVPAALEDGRELIVPLDRYHITPVGGRY